MVKYMAKCTVKQNHIIFPQRQISSIDYINVTSKKRFVNTYNKIYNSDRIHKNTLHDVQVL